MPQFCFSVYLSCSFHLINSYANPQHPPFAIDHKRLQPPAPATSISSFPFCRHEFPPYAHKPHRLVINRNNSTLPHSFSLNSALSYILPEFAHALDADHISAIDLITRSGSYRARTCDSWYVGSAITCIGDGNLH